MELNQIKQIKPEVDRVFCTHKSSDSEVMSTKECKQYFEKFELTDKRITDIKNNLIGIVNKIINSYFDDFR